jgi:hypothetical protein
VPAIDFTRRQFGGLFAGAAAGGRKPRVACILNAYFPNSHADVFIGRLLEGYRLNGRTYAPRVETVSFFVHQFPVNDMAREQAAEYGVRIYPSVAEALRAGGLKIAVDGVAIIGEHGDYPRTRRGNVMYPRKRWFDEVTAVMEADRKIVPLFNDKYLAYEWPDALAMYQRVRDWKIPFASGSSLPLTWRRPALEFTRGIALEDVLAVSNSDLEEHGYHAIELMQAMVERRRGGESGIAQIRCVEGEAVWKDPFWPRELLDAALSRRVNPAPENKGQTPQAIFIRYRDGLKASVLNLNSHTRDYLFAARETGGRMHSTCFYIQLYVHNHWSFMVRQFEDLVLTKRTPTPPERTLLANGIMLSGLESRVQGQRWLDTPELDIRYSF